MKNNPRAPPPFFYLKRVNMVRRKQTGAWRWRLSREAAHWSASPTPGKSRRDETRDGWTDGRMDGWMAGGGRMDGGARGGNGERRNVKAAALESDLGRKVALPWRPGESSAAAAEREGGSDGVDSALQRAARLFSWRRPTQSSRWSSERDALLGRQIILFSFILTNQRQFGHRFLSFNH